MLQRSCQEIAERRDFFVATRFFRRAEIFSSFFRRSARILGGYMLPPFIFAPFLASSGEQMTILGLAPMNLPASGCGANSDTNMQHIYTLYPAIIPIYALLLDTLLV